MLCILGVLRQIRQMWVEQCHTPPTTWNCKSWNIYHLEKGDLGRGSMVYGMSQKLVSCEATGREMGDTCGVTAAALAQLPVLCVFWQLDISGRNHVQKITPIFFEKKQGSKKSSTMEVSSVLDCCTDGGHGWHPLEVAFIPVSSPRTTWSWLQHGMPQITCQLRWVQGNMTTFSRTFMFIHFRKDSRDICRS